MFENQSQENALESAAAADLHVFGENGEFQVSEEVYSETKKAVSAQHSVSNRWLAAEPGISKAFGAEKDDEGKVINGDCYTAGTPAYKAMVAMLTECHPLSAKLAGQVEKVKQLRAGGAEPEAVSEAEFRRDDSKRRIHTDTQNGVRALREYFVKNRGGEKAERKTKVPMDILIACSERLAKFNGDNSTPADLEIAERANIVIKAMIQDLGAVYGSIPLAKPAAPIDRSFTQSGPAENLTAEQYAERLAEEALSLV